MTCWEKSESWRNPNRIAQVVQNLIGNAFKFSESGTVVTVEVRSIEESVEIAVRDQGLGIKESELPNVFGAFEPTSTRATAGERGAGLGLAICEKIVDAHGGRISVTSVEGEGTRFAFTLPVG